MNQLELEGKVGSSDTLNGLIFFQFILATFSIMETTCSEVGWGNRPCIIDATCEDPDSFFCEGHISHTVDEKIVQQQFVRKLYSALYLPSCLPGFVLLESTVCKEKTSLVSFGFWNILHQFGFTKKKQTEQIVSLFIIPHLEITRTWWERRLLMVFDWLLQGFQIQKSSC